MADRIINSVTVRFKASSPYFFLLFFAASAYSVSPGPKEP